jgi:ribonuclease-3
MSDSLAGLEDSLGYRFKDRALLEQALAHGSWAREKGKKDNERLEFLGDAVLGLAASDMLMSRFAGDDKNEGELSRMRAALVSRLTLARAATAIDLGPHILLGRGELGSGGAGKPSILEGTFEAIIAAVFLDGGYMPARELVEHLLGPWVAEGPLETLDPKSALQEQLARLGRGVPSYVVASKSGPDHMPVYEVEVQEGSAVLASGRGGGRKAAEREAASEALKKLGTGG